MPNDERDVHYWNGFEDGAEQMRERAARGDPGAPQDEGEADRSAIRAKNRAEEKVIGVYLWRLGRRASMSNQSLPHGSSADGISSGGSGAPAWPVQQFIALQAILLPPNEGVSGTGEPWIALGIVPKIHPSMNLWVKRVKQHEP